MVDKEGQYFAGKIKDIEKVRGWFFGSFMDHPLLQCDSVEVAWQHVPNVTPYPEQKHFHKHSVEINVILKGWVHITINGNRHTFEPGDVYIVWPNTIVEAVETGEDTELIVVRSPSVPGDKFLMS